MFKVLTCYDNNIVISPSELHSASAVHRTQPSPAFLTSNKNVDCEAISQFISQFIRWSTGKDKMLRGPLAGWLNGEWYDNQVVPGPYYRVVVCWENDNLSLSLLSTAKYKGEAERKRWSGAVTWGSEERDTVQWGQAAGRV